MVKKRKKIKVKNKSKKSRKVKKKVVRVRPTVRKKIVRTGLPTAKTSKARVFRAIKNLILFGVLSFVFYLLSEVAINIFVNTFLLLLSIILGLIAIAFLFLTLIFIIIYIIRG